VKQQFIVISGKFPDDWPEDIVCLMGKIAIAFAQLEQATIVTAKRFDLQKRKLLEFALTDRNRKKFFDSWCDVLVEAFHDRSELRALAETARCLGEERNALFHGNWYADKSTGERRIQHLPRRGDTRQIPLDPAYFGGLVRRIRSTRNKLLKAKPSGD